MKKYDIQPFDISSASKDEWTKFHKYRRVRMSELLPEDPVQDDATHEAWVKTALEESEIISYAVTAKEDSSNIIAWLQMYLLKETSPSYP